MPQVPSAKAAIDTRWNLLSLSIWNSSLSIFFFYVAYPFTCGAALG
jgi:hypothetical protein